MVKRVLKKGYGLLRLVVLNIRSRRGNAVVRRTLPGSNLQVYSKRAHVRSNEQEIIRLASYVNQCEGDLDMVDVGANIGMVTLLIHQHLQIGRYLCLDGNDEFFPLLQRNLAQVPNSTCEKTYLSDHPGQKTMRTKTYVNTASILESATGASTVFTTLDERCLANNLQPNFVKIDTDGYDSKILRGFSKHLSTVENMVVYFEYAPMHQVFNAIENEPTVIFDDLFGFGYEEFHFYDEQGAYFGCIPYQDKARLLELTRYCLSSCKLYNVLIYHKNNRRFKDAFTLGEKLNCEEAVQKWAAWWALH